MTLDEKIAYLKETKRYGFEDLVLLVEVLRSEKGCPWDREQTHGSIRKDLIEETYEVIEAIDTENAVLLQEERGDLLFQIVFHSQIEEEKGTFCMDEVVNDICKKMIHRHPHVFGTVEVENSREVLSNWEAIKTEEKQRNTLVERLKAIPPMLPALMRASKVSKKAGKTTGVSQEELLEKLARDQQKLHQKAIDHETIGNLLLTVAQLAQLSEVDAEHALSDATDRLIAEVERKN